MGKKKQDSIGKHPYLGIVKSMLGGNYRTVDEISPEELTMVERRLRGCLAQIEAIRTELEIEGVDILEIIGKDKMMDAVKAMERSTSIIHQSHQQRKILLDEDS